MTSDNEALNEELDDEERYAQTLKDAGLLDDDPTPE